jgi:hypothetical protein
LKGIADDQTNLNGQSPTIKADSSPYSYFSSLFIILVIGYWLLFGAWNLVIGV